MSTLALGAGVSGCGVESEPIGTHEALIINGTRSGDLYPAVVALVYRVGGITESFCTGTLVSKRHVVTAAHCLAESQVPSWFQMGVYFGPNASQATAAQVINIVEKIPHPKYDNTITPNTLADVSDIAVVRLASDAPVAPMPMLRPSEAGYVAYDRDVLIAGYGLTNASDARSSGVKYHALATLYQVGDSEILVASVKGVSTCQGDSGGPTLVNVAEDGATPDYRLFGVTSRGSEGCQAGSVQTRVDTFLPWIHENAPDIPCGSGNSEDCKDGTNPYTPKSPLGTACKKHDECEGGICAIVAGVGVCTESCKVDGAAACAAGFECSPLKGDDGVCTKIPPKAKGETCSAHSDCESELCAGDGSRSYCSAFCDPAVAGSCGEGMVCVSAGPDKSVCIFGGTVSHAAGDEGSVPGGKPGDCSLANQPTKDLGFPSIVLFLLGVALVGRRRR